MTGPEARGTVLTVCFPRDVSDFAMLPAQKLLAGNQPRPQDLLAFQYGGDRREDPGTQQKSRD